MFKEIKIHAHANERTGYGIHASRFFPMLDKVVQEHPDDSGTVHISLLDVVSASHHELKFPPSPSILFNVWESTEYPEGFMRNLGKYDQLWVPSEWQRACSISQGIPEEQVKVVPEGVDPDTYKPDPTWNGESDTFNFVTVGQWQPRKSTQEIIEAFLKAFPKKKFPDVRLHLSVDTLFPSDEYKSTEERLKAYGLQDSRLVVVHFEEREEYVRRLQQSHCFVSCARSEGWGLPIIEAMACGVPTIMADWSGSTEYARSEHGIKVRIKELIKPFGIYGNWEVPGKWCQPDYDHLVEVMKDVHANWYDHKKKAMETSEHIRKNFSWEAAAHKACKVLEEFHAIWKSCENVKLETQNTETSENDIRVFAAKHGFEITGLRPRSAIFTVNCWPNSKDKMDTLIETLKQIKLFGYPVLISTHFPLPQPVIEMADYYLYEKRDIMSGDDKPVYWRQRVTGERETKQASVEYQGVAALNCFRNSIDFCRGRYDWIYDMSADMEVDLEEWVRMVTSSAKPMVCIPYEGVKNGIGGGLWAGRVEALDKLIPRLDSWKQYADMFPDLKFIAERWIFAYIQSLGYNMEEDIEWINIETTNRFDNVDREIWDDDDFVCHFLEGPFLEIKGISRREYDVSYIDVDNGNNEFNLQQKVGMWSRANHKYFKNWVIKASLDGKEKFSHTLDLKGKNVLISFGSKALGDTIAWIPYVEEFRKKHGCTVYCSGWWQEAFDYPEINFVKPGTALEKIYASYMVGCFDNQPELNPVNWREVPLQKVSADILGIDYKPLRAHLKVQPHTNKNRYVCFSEHSTMLGKYWNRPGAWQEVIDYLNSKGYDCISVASERSSLKNVIQHAGQPIQKTIADIAGCSFYVGLNHGPSWVAIALNKPAIMITGMSEPWNDFPNPYRLSVDVCRPGCFNDPSVPLQRGFDWCPRNKKYACTGEITEEMVIKVIDKLVRKDKCQLPLRKIKVVDIKSAHQAASMRKELPLKKQKRKNAC